MIFNVTWTLNAREDLKQIIQYLEKNWSTTDVDNFRDKLFQRIDILSKWPAIGRASDKDPSIRRIVITKHNLLFYEIENDEIVILNIFDTRQDPIKTPY